MTPLCRAVRLVALRDLLLTGRSYSTAELAGQFRVGRWTIWKDLQLLQGEPFYLPLVMDRIHEVRWKVMDLNS